MRKPVRTVYPCGHVSLTDAKSCDHGKHTWRLTKVGGDIALQKLVGGTGDFYKCTKCGFAVPIAWEDTR